jgi:hypothetical protein
LSESIATLGLLLVIILVREPSSSSGSIWRRGLHHRRLLVCFFHLLRPPRGHYGEVSERYVCRNQTGAAVALYRFLLWPREKSVQEVPHSGKDHGHAETVGGGDHVIVAD